MQIKYKNSMGSEVSEQQALGLDYYKKCVYNGSTLEKEALVIDGLEIGVTVYNNRSQTHPTIIASNLASGHNWIIVSETEFFQGGFKLVTAFCYHTDGGLDGKYLTLFDSNGDEIAREGQDEKGVTDYTTIEKFYWDRGINPDKYLFECIYNESTGAFRHFDWNNEHVDNFGQGGFVLYNNPSDIQELVDLTGMSQDLIDYYLSSAAQPNFPLQQ